MLLSLAVLVPGVSLTALSPGWGALCALGAHGVWQLHNTVCVWPFIQAGDRLPGGAPALGVPSEALRHRLGAHNVLLLLGSRLICGILLQAPGAKSCHDAAPFPRAQCWDSVIVLAGNWSAVWAGAEPGEAAPSHAQDCLPAPAPPPAS